VTNNRSEWEIIREAAGMKPDQITDAYSLDLHTRHMRSAGRSENTIKDRRGAIRRLGDFLDPYTRNPRAVIEATSDQLAEWQANCEGLKEKTVAVYIEHIQGYYKWLYRPMRIIAESPADDLIKPVVKRRRPRPIPEEDLRFALDACTDQRLLTWLILGAYAGLRAVDMSLLDRDDVLTDSDVPMLRVRGKGGYEDVIDVGTEVVRALEPWRMGGRRRGAMFTDEDGKRLDPKDIFVAVNEYLERLGLPYTCHQLRHRYGTRLYVLTRDIRYVQRQMRHRSVASTELYALIPTDKGAESMRALDAELAERPRGRRTHRELTEESVHVLDAELAERLLLPTADEPTFEPPVPAPATPRTAVPRPPVPMFSGG
jgi:integrase/recombinase XerC